MPEGTGIGVYVKGLAYELSQRDEISIARNITQERKGKKTSEDDYVHFIGDNVRRVYKVVPEEIWINDVELDGNGKYVKDIRVELSIEELKKLI